VQDILQYRLTEQKEPVGAKIKFSKNVTSIIGKIHNYFKSIPLDELSLPENEPLLEDFEVTKESLRDKDIDQVLTIFEGMAMGDVRLLYKVFES